MYYIQLIEFIYNTDSMKKLIKTNNLTNSKILFFLLSLLCHIIAFTLFLLNPWILPIKNLFFNHFTILLIFSLFLTVKIYLYNETAPLIIFIGIKSFVLFLLGYPLGDNIELELFVFISILLETGLLLTSPYNLIIICALNPIFILSQKGISAWWYNTSNIPLHEILFTSCLCIVISFIILILDHNIQIRKNKEIKITRLDSAISQLTDANIGFQGYIKIIELEAIVNERKRLSREIHDAVGYSLTNIIMLLEEAYLQVNKDIKRQKEVIINAKNQAVSGLEETRFALRHLREEKIKKENGLIAINELIKTFTNATGIKINVEYGNLPSFTNEVVDIIMFRMIQEGMTNAFRHGMATKITILFWLNHGMIRLIIHDNGSGSSEITEGIGIAGMKERLANIGGSLVLKNVIDGFELKAEIPWEKGG